MPTLFAPPRYTPVSGNGTTYPGGLLYFYTTGTSTPKNTYSESSLVTPNANPVVADANGLFGPIYLTTGDYKVVLKDADATTIWTVDPVSGLGATDTLTTRGDLLTRDASGYTRLAIGSAAKVLTSDGVDASWQTPIIPRDFVQGLTYANGTDATNDIDIAVGCAMDSTNARMMVLAAATTKRLDAAWAVGSGNGGLDTGSIADTDYYIWLIERSDTGVVDGLFSASATAPTMPTSYSYKRLIGYFKRASSAIVAFKTYQESGGGIEYSWVTPTLDVNLANTLTTSRRTDAVKVPLTFSVKAHLRVAVSDSSTTQATVITCPDEADVAPSATVAPLNNFGQTGATSASYDLWVRTSATGTIAARSNLATVDLYALVTLGFIWSRRP